MGCLPPIGIPLPGRVTSIFSFSKLSFLPKILTRMSFTSFAEEVWDREDNVSLYNASNSSFTKAISLQRFYNPLLRSQTARLGHLDNLRKGAWIVNRQLG